MKILEDRQKLFNEYKGIKENIARSFLDYNRYYEADMLIKSFQELGQNIPEMKVLDYGCGVGDYGMVFGRLGSSIIFFDFLEYINFVKYRTEKEEIKADFLVVDVDSPFIDVDFVIFGEVLEHLLDPLAILTEFVNKKIKYIFTSSYPFRSDDPKDYYWTKIGHDNPGIYEAQSSCRELLFNHYTDIKYKGEGRLWIIKK